MLYNITSYSFGHCYLLFSMKAFPTIPMQGYRVVFLNTTQLNNRFIADDKTPLDTFQYLTRSLERRFYQKGRITFPRDMSPLSVSVYWIS